MDGDNFNHAPPPDGIDAVLDKIKKMVRLANGTSEQGERDAAMRMAKKMADAHGIALDSVDADSPGPGQTLMYTDGRRQRFSGCEYGLAVHILKKHFAVQVIMRIEGGGGPGHAIFFGCRINIEVAKYAWDIMLRESRKAWNAYRRKSSLMRMIERGYRLPGSAARLVRKPDKGAFMSGWFFRIDQKLTENPIRNDIEQFNAERALMERDFQRYCAHNNVKESKGRKAKQDFSAVMAGMSSAEAVSLNRPCEGRWREQTLLA